MKVLLLSHFQGAMANWCHEHLKEEICRQHPTRLCGRGYPNYDEEPTASDLEARYQPDVIVSYGWKQWIREVEAPVAMMIVDAYPAMGDISSTVNNYVKFLKTNSVNLLLAFSPQSRDNLLDAGVATRIELLPYSVDTNIYQPIKMEKDIDVLAAFREHPSAYPFRAQIHEMLREMPLVSHCKFVIHRQHINAINRSKIVVHSNNKYGALCWRYFEVLACGGFLLTDKPTGYDCVGLVPGEHFAVYETLDDLEKKIYYYLNHPEERDAIASAGMKFVRENHSMIQRVREFTDIVKENVL